MFTDSEIRTKAFLHIMESIDPMYRDGFRSWYYGEWFNLRYQQMLNNEIRILTKLFVDMEQDSVIADNEGESDA